LAHTCSHGVLHYNEDLVKIERKYLDKQKERYHPIITDFTRTTQPLIRYELNDIIVDKKEACPCGSIFQAIDHIEGRSDDLFYCINRNGQTVRIFPDFIRRAIITADERILIYQVVQISPQELNIYIESDYYSTLKITIQKALEQLFQSFNIDSMRYYFFDQLPLLGTGKLRRVCCNFSIKN